MVFKSLTGFIVFYMVFALPQCNVVHLWLVPRGMYLPHKPQQITHKRSTKITIHHLNDTAIHTNPSSSPPPLICSHGRHIDRWTTSLHLHPHTCTSARRRGLALKLDRCRVAALFLILRIIHRRHCSDHRTCPLIPVIARPQRPSLYCPVNVILSSCRR